MERNAGEVGSANASNAVLTLRGWLDRLAATHRLTVMRPGIGLVHELAAVANRLDGKTASFFPHPGGHPGSVVSGLVSSRAWMAEALGVPQSGLVRHFQDAAANPLPWREVADGPAQEVVHRTDIDLLKLLPIPTHNEYDSGPYISAGLTIARDPETGVQNVSIHRCQISGPDRIGILLLPRHTDHFYRKAEAAGRPLEVALVVSVDPATLLSSQAIVPVGHDELEIAGALRGTPLDVVRCKTNQVRVPAEAEIVIEGRLLPGTREPEGPFGEFPQYYGERADRHVLEVDAVTHRIGPIFHTIVGGGLEHLLLGAIPREATILATLQRNFPGCTGCPPRTRRRRTLPPVREAQEDAKRRGKECPAWRVCGALRHQARRRRRSRCRYPRSRRSRMGHLDPLPG